jgi:5-methylcytosine-specific restriction protein A
MAVHPPVHRPLGRAQPLRRVSRSRIYNRRWQKLRAAYLASHPVCECGCGRAATVVDHRRPHKGDAGLMYDWDNLQAMTKPCHDAKTARQDGGFGHPVR